MKKITHLNNNDKHVSISCSENNNNIVPTPIWCDCSLVIAVFKRLRCTTKADMPRLRIPGSGYKIRQVEKTLGIFLSSVSVSPHVKQRPEIMAQ